MACPVIGFHVGIYCSHIFPTYTALSLLEYMGAWASAEFCLEGGEPIVFRGKRALREWGAIGLGCLEGVGGGASGPFAPLCRRPCIGGFTKFKQLCWILQCICSWASGNNSQQNTRYNMLPNLKSWAEKITTGKQPWLEQILGLKHLRTTWKSKHSLHVRKTRAVKLDCHRGWISCEVQCSDWGSVVFW